MKKVIGLILMLVLSVYLILMFINMSRDYDKVLESVSFTAIENTDSEEILYVHQLIYEITDIHINGVHQVVNDVVVSINSIEEGSIILVDNVTGAGDIIDINYTYQEPSSEFTSSFIDAVPLLMIIIVVGGFGYAVHKFR